jgi:pSer/pThr/pTyr-binding forkhead associated (FHA) protein
MTVHLTILRGPNNGKTYTFEDDVITIGSGRGNTLIIHDNDVSTEHCRLMRIDVDYDIEDADSRYGTYVNGQPLDGEKWLLHSGSIIELGSQVTIEYRLPEELIKPRVISPYVIREGEPGSQPCLVLVEEAEIKEAYLLQSADITVGRSVGNDIVIQQTDISRTHLRVFWKDRNFHVEDMNSRNGTFINGIAVTETRKLVHSDVIRVGTSIQLHYVFREDLPEGWDPIASGVDERAFRETEETIPFLQVRRDSTRELGADLKEGDLQQHILVAYARDDWEDIVAPIVLNLEDAKQQVWVDQYLRPNSEPWYAAIEYAQSECWLLVVVVSPEALQSEMVRDVYRYFFNREKPIILVDYKSVERLPFQLSQVPTIEYDRESPGKMFRQLLYEIMQLKPRSMDGENY